MKILTLQIYIHLSIWSKINKAFCTKQSLTIFSKGNRNASHENSKGDNHSISRLFSYKNPGNFHIFKETFPSVLIPMISHSWKFPQRSSFFGNFMLMIFLVSIGATQTCQQGNGPLLGNGKRSCLLLLPKINTEDTKDFYYTCHIRWSKLKMKLKSPP